jgi:hypothetical protein
LYLFFSSYLLKPSFISSFFFFFFHPYHLISWGGGKTLCLFLSIFPCMIIIVLLNNLFFKIFIDIKTTSKMVENYKIIFFF